MELASLTNVAFAGIAVFGAVLTALALLAYRRLPSPRMAMVAGGFLLITLQGVVVGIGLFTGGWDTGTLLLLSAGFEAALLAVLFGATLVR
ncbi:MAG: hypothetical protein L3K17_03700 [Thermoplasmata archaeon]|nr:hypothetical protein [Thermoplasmata archaeon]